MRLFPFLMGLSLLTIPVLAIDQSPFTNIDGVITQLGFAPYYSKKPVRRVSVAVLDQGFYGYEKEIGKTLPADTVYHIGPVPLPGGRGGPFCSGTVGAPASTRGAGGAAGF